MYNEEWKGETKEQTRSRNIKRRYNMTFEDLRLLLESQNYKCPISQDDIDEYSGVVDHQHDTGYVRGILSNNSNTALGLLGDNPESLLRAIQYLKEYKEWRDDTVEH